MFATKQQPVPTGSLLGAALLALALPACQAGLPAPGVRDAAAQNVAAQAPAAEGALEIRGVVTFETGEPRAERYRVQATVGEVANAATVSLIDAKSGNTVSSSVTDERGAFTLTFSNFNPVSGAPYTLEAVKGLALGGKPNRPGAPAVRVRTLLFWNGGWQSLTNTTPGVGITISPATTAVATLVSLKKSAGQDLDLPALIGKVSGSDFDAGGTGLSRATDFAPVLGLVGSALALDQDPVAAIAYDPAARTYRLAASAVAVAAIEPAIPVPGGKVTVRGAGFDPNPGRSIYWFGQYPAATWSVAADRSSVTVDVPAGAYSAAFTLQQPGGVLVTLDPFLKLKGTVGTLAGDGTAGGRDGVGTGASFNGPYGVACDRQGNLYVADRTGCRIRKITPGGAVTTLAGGGCGLADGAGSAARFRDPLDLTIDGSDNLYVADYGNHRVCKITPAGAVTTLAGDGSAGYVEGTGTGARFNGPERIAADPGGNVYVADYANRRIRKITPAGVTSTYAGTGTVGCTDNAAPLGGTVGDVMGMDLDSDGNLWLADWGCRSVRRIAPGGGA